MKGHDYPFKHFEMMHELAGRLRDTSVQLLAHSYHYETFGSWWFTFMRHGERYRVVFDGKDFVLRFEQNVGLGFKADWPVISEDPISDKTSTEIINAVLSLIVSL
jgi:hypothetical protein